MLGQAKVKWGLQRSGPQGSYIEWFTAENTYIDEKKILWDKRQSPDRRIGPGNISLPFQFTLPPNCESSFPKGHIFFAQEMCIQYKLHAKLVTDKLLTVDPKYELPIKVQKITDANRPDLMLPSHQSGHSEVGCFCCNSGEMNMTVNVPYTGLCIGTSVPLTVNVENSSTSRFKLSAAIYRSWTFLACNQMKQSCSTIVFVQSPEIEPNSQTTWEVDNLLIPFDTIPTIEGCEIIKTEDTIDVKADLPWTCGDPSVTFPVIIGNVPIRT